MRGENGQATLEWVGVVLVVSLGLGALLVLAPGVDGRSLGGFLAHRIGCAARGGCDDGDAALARAYGARDAALVREQAPNLVYEPGERQLPVDWRRCRSPACAGAPDDRRLDVHRSDRGTPATVFTRVLRRGGRTYLQYWLYYPDSNTTVAGSDKVWEALWLVPRLRGLVDGTPRYPGFHRDDWESYHVRVEPDGSAWVRASSHGGYRSCKEKRCEGRWIGRTGWTRVSRGSHAGHIPLRAEPLPGRGALVPRGKTPGAPPARMRYVPLYPGQDLDERTTSAEGLRLVPLETLDRSGYRPLDDEIRPPWGKDVYRDPESDDS